MTEREWDEAAAWINLKWDRQPLDPVVAKAWFSDLERFSYDDVARAINRLVGERSLRPQLPDLLATVKAVAAGHPAPALLPHISQTKRYGQAWYAVGMAVREKRLPRAELDALAEKHKLWFARFGEDSTATMEMVAEVENLAKKSDTVLKTPVTEGRPKFQSRYSDAHKAQYLANVAAKKEAESSPTKS